MLIDLLDFKINFKIKITIILITFFVIIAIIWLFVGSIPLAVYGKGILFSHNQYIVSVVANTKGILKDLAISQGVVVRSGQLIAKVYNPTLPKRLLQQKEVVQTLLQQKNEVIALLNSVNETHEKNFSENLIGLTNNIQLLESTVNRLKIQYKDYTTLFKKKIITKNILDQARVSLNQALIDLNNANNALTQLNSNKYFLLEDLKYKYRQIDLQLVEANKEIELLSSESSDISNIIAPVDGKIIEHKVPLGAWVNEGTTITSLLVTNDSQTQKVNDKYLFTYFPTRLGKLIKVGMIVKVVPTTIFKEEYGSIIGVVDMVSPFAVSKESMFSVLHNGALVQEFYNHPSLIFARIKLEHNPKDDNGFFWTSKEGPKFEIEDGTIADAMVILEYKKPIHLIMKTKT